MKAFGQKLMIAIQRNDPINSYYNLLDDKSVQHEFRPLFWEIYQLLMQYTDARTSPPEIEVAVQVDPVAERTIVCASVLPPESILERSNSASLK